MLGALQGTLAMYETDAGKNDWHVETLGELNDLILYPDNTAYTLSSDGLLSLFDTTTETIKWKKQLPNGKTESYKMRHFGPSLLVFSDERASMIHSQSNQTIFEEPLGGEGPSVAELF